jgi:UDP-2-acetamido-3-amino-2,3-dideoxy-glucuronate N-acetyltransferase
MDARRDRRDNQSRIPVVVTTAADSAVFAHRLALCESDDVGPGTRIWPFAHVMEGAHVGAGCNICESAFIEAGAWVGDGVTVKNGVLIWDRVTIEDHVFLGPGAVFTNDLFPRAASRPDELLPTLVQRGATVGANATVICGVTIGRHAFVGAGAVVTRDVPAHARVVGNPAVQVGWSCACGASLDGELACRCGARA